MKLASRVGVVCVIGMVVGCRTAAGFDPNATDGAAGSGDPTVDAGPTTRGEPPIVRFSREGIIVETYAGSDVMGNDDGIGTKATFNNPVGIDFDRNGGLLVTEYEGAQLRRIAANGFASRVSAGLRDAFGVLVTDTATYVETDRNAEGVKSDVSGTIWRVVDGVPQVIATGLNRPRGLTETLDGRIAIADRERNVLITLDPRSATIAQFNDPYGLATLPDGSLVVADRGNHCIRRVMPNGDVGRYAGDGNPGMKDDLDKLAARFDSPIDVATDALGNVYVSDEGNRRIRVITTTGEVATIAGDGVQGFADGAGPAARFYGQEQLISAPDGKTLYVTDGNKGELTPPYHRVRRIRVP